VAFRARILPTVGYGTSFAVAAGGSLDSDEDGSSDYRFASDDPALPGDEDETKIAVEPQALVVPTLGASALTFLALLLAVLAAHRLTRRHHTGTPGS